MKSFFLKIKKWTMAHKKTSIFLLLIIIGGTYWSVKAFGTDNSTQTRYVISSVQKGNIESTVNGSGQVSAARQLNLSFGASGDINTLNVKVGQEVKEGEIIAQIDSLDAYYEYQTAKLSYDKLVNLDPNDLRKSENTYNEAKSSVDNAYVSGKSALTKASTDMTDISDGLKDLFDCNTGYIGCQNFSLSDTGKVYRNTAQTSYDKANVLLDNFSDKFSKLSDTSTKADVLQLISQAIDTSFAFAQATKDAQEAIIYFKKSTQSSASIAKSDEAYTAVTALVSTANSLVLNLSSSKTSILNSNNSLMDAENSLDDLKNGPDVLDLRSSELSLKQKQDALSNYIIRAPFDGIIASVDLSVGDKASSGSTVATIISKQKIAEISLTEIDVAKVTEGQAVKLSFDAIDNLILSGKVSEVDLVGTVSQGVVSYKVKIAFDDPEGKIKPGMSVSADIVTNSKENVLVVPVAAVKTQGNFSYVETSDPASPPSPPKRIRVTTGVSNDEFIEITSGLNEGDKYISRTIVGTAVKAATATAPSLFGGGTRVQTGVTGGANRTFQRVN